MNNVVSHDEVIEKIRRGSFCGDSVRFIAAGLFNTALTFLLYQLLLLFFSPEISYSFSWLVGLIFVMTFYPGRVFPSGGKSWYERLAMGASYILVFTLGFLLLRLLVNVGLSSRLAIVFVMALTTMVNFVLARLISYYKYK